MTATLIRLAFSGIRSRALASALTVFLAAAAAATVVLALEVGETGRDPWQRTFVAAHGAHVLANVGSEREARALQSLEGVTEAGAPVPEMTVDVETAAGLEPLRLFGLAGRPRVNVPVGTATPGGGIVLERSVADVLGLETRVTVAGHSLRVAGTAILPSVSRFPRSNPGRAWVDRATLERLQPDRSQWRWSEALRIADPAAARSVADHILAGAEPGTVDVVTWEDQRASVLMDAAPLQLILAMYTIVLLGVVFAVVAILVGARALEQSREIGLLKAIGLTPRQVTAVFVFESAALGAIAVVLGFAAGALLAPQLAGMISQTTLGSPNVAARPAHLLIAGVPVLSVLVLSAWVTTRRRTRFSVLHAIQSGRSAPPSGSLLVSLLAALPARVPLAVGIRTMLSGRGRALLLSAAIALTGAGFVFALSMQATLSDQPDGKPSDVATELPVLVYTLDAVLLVITAASLLAVALLALRERLRDFGVLKALGLTPRQVASTLVSPYALVALLAGVVAIPVGVALYVAVFHAAGGDGDPVIAPWPWLALVPVATVLLVVAATSVPARIAAHAPAADVLRAE
jgi:ABC-type lipoprotein release transport system permease subunit